MTSPFPLLALARRVLGAKSTRSKVLPYLAGLRSGAVFLSRLLYCVCTAAFAASIWMLCAWMVNMTSLVCFVRSFSVDSPSPASEAFY